MAKLTILFGLFFLAVLTVTSADYVCCLFDDGCDSDCQYVNKYNDHSLCCPGCKGHLFVNETGCACDPDGTSGSEIHGGAPDPTVCQSWATTGAATSLRFPAVIITVLSLLCAAFNH